MNQKRAWELLDGLRSAMDSVDYKALKDVFKMGDSHSREERDAILAGLREFVRKNGEELGLLQKALLPDEVHTEFAASDYLEEDDYIYMSPWRQLWRLRDQPLVKALLLLVGEGFTRFPELSAFESAIPTLMEQLAEEIPTLPVEDEGVDQTAGGTRVMSKSLLAIWPEVWMLSPSTVAHLKKLLVNGPATHDELAGSGSPDSVANLLRHPKKLKLVELAARDGKLYVWQLTALGVEALKFLG